MWEVRDGMIVGKHAGMKYNDFLRTRKHYANFILKVKFQLVNGEGNSGMQFRGKPVPDSHEASGYQAGIGQQYGGFLCDESRRKRVLAKPSEATLAGLDKAGWNEYELHVEGNHIVLKLNGKTTVDYTESEPGIDDEGFIALQVHSGDRGTVQGLDDFDAEVRLLAILQPHPNAKRIASQTSSILVAVRLETRRSKCSFGIVIVLCKLTAQGLFIPSSRLRSTSDATPRRDEEIGATVTLVRTLMAVFRVRITHGRCLSGAPIRHK